MGENVRDWIIRHEGLRQFPYLDTAPIPKTTIGVGRNLSDNGISIEEAMFLLDNDIERCRKDLEGYSWYRKQPSGVKDALLNMCFNLGINKLLKFKNMIKHLNNGEYTQAASEALDSNWSKQVGKRAFDIATVIREGK